MDLKAEIPDTERFTPEEITYLLDLSAEIKVKKEKRNYRIG